MKISKEYLRQIQFNIKDSKATHLKTIALVTDNVIAYR